MDLIKQNRDCPVLYVVVPCYNEEEVLPETAKRMRTKLRGLIAEKKISPRSRIMFVNDGSRDRTWEMIETLAHADPLFAGVKLSRNRGHQNAVLAGLMTARGKCDCAISIDADLQDDINAIDGMVADFCAGSDIVYGVRSSRDTDTFFKRFTAEGYYHVMQRMGVELVFNHADYRLMSARALEALSSYREVNLFLRGIVPQIGYKTSTVTYARTERFAGESKYPLKKMLALAWDGITSFSLRPVSMLIGLGLLITGGSLIAGLVLLIIQLVTGSLTGTAAILFSIWLACGLILCGLGLTGEYIGKIYEEVKDRPRYFIEAVSLDPSIEKEDEPKDVPPSDEISESTQPEEQ